MIVLVVLICWQVAIVAVDCLKQPFGLTSVLKLILPLKELKFK